MLKLSLLSFMTFICFAVKLFQAETTDIDSNALLTKLLDLHQYHCGETATCGSSEHVEPSEFLIPVPCCIPCSCLPSCAEQQNCCPGSMNLTQSLPMTTSGLDNIVLENVTNKADNNGMILQRKDLVTSNSTDENKAELSVMDELRIENSTVFDTKDSEVLKMDESDRANEKCTRPQVFYRPNRYLDSAAYMMVTTCPEGVEDKLIIDKCNAGIGEAKLLDMIPVTSKLSGLTYKNKHCLLCYEKLQPEQIIEWSAEIVSSGARRERVFLPSIETIVDNLMETITTFSNIHFVPGDKSLTRPCKASDIISCNQTGLWDNYDELTETLCFHGYHLPIIHKIDKHSLTFKNIACLHCNTGRGVSENSLSCEYWEDPGQNRHQSTFSVTLNMRNVVPDEPNKMTVMPAPYIDHEVIQQFQHRRCPFGKLDLLGRCRGVICPRDHYVVADQCVPLYDTVKGLDLNIKIEITPSQAIPDDIAEVFVDSLKKMADKALSDAVHLKRRQVSLWYLPRSYGNPTEYYLLDVFLFSPSNVIKYSAAIEQIKQFLFIMKTGVNMAVLESSNIKLNFQFKHGLRQRTDKYLDMSNGRTLEPRMEKEWTLTIPVPHMTISEVNWCFRTVFELTEIEVLGDYIRVKSTDVLVFIDQTDSLQTQMYICIDMFIKQRNVEEDFQINQEEKSPTDDDGDEDDDDDITLSGEIVVDSERGLILTVSLIAFIVLLGILYRVKSAKAKKQIEQSARLYQPPSDFVELNVISDLNINDHM